MRKTIIVNFKTYQQSTAKNARKLAKICKEVSKKTGVNIFAAVQLADLSSCAKICDTLSQHIDAISYGANTGFVLCESVKENGAKGTLLNHSEHKLPLDIIEKSIKSARKSGLLVFACADTPRMAQKIAALNPDFIAIEPPELIGGNISVSKAKPQLIADTIKKVHAVKKIPILCGAGVKTKEDVQIACRLGSQGVLVASGIVLAKNPKKALMDLAQGFI